MYFCLNLEPATKKNSQQMAYNKATGKRFPVQSKAYRKFEREALKQIPKPKVPISIPVNVKCIFYVKTMRKVDGLNLSAAMDDILVKAGVLEDDNRDVVAGHDGSRVYLDRDNPRIEITITEMPEYAQWKE